MSKILLNKSNIDLDYPICRPSLDLDFTQEVLDERITFSRGSIGTRVNRNRLIETVSANTPRFDYDPVTGECKGLLIEESRSNLFTSSNDFTVWTKQTNRTGVVGITTNALTSPDGTTNATGYFVQTGGGTFYAIYRSFTAAANTYYTYSVFVKAGEFNTIGLTIFDGSNNNGVTYNVINGTVVSSYSAVNMTIGNLSIVNYGNGWYRCIFPFSHSLGGSFTPKIDLGGTSSNYGVYIWGAQLEAGAFPTTYIPTSGSTVTRSADNANMTGSNFSSWYNQNEGTLYASINNITTRSSISFDSFVSIAGTDVNRNVMRIYTQTASGGGAQNKFFGAIAYSPDGSYVVNSFDSNVGGPDRIGRAILAYKKDNFAFTVNGLTPTRDVSGDIPTCNQLLIFGSARFQPAPSGTISRLTYYPRALKPNQLVALTQ